MIERGGLVSLRVLPNVQQKTIEPIIASQVEKGAIFYTDEYNIYNNIQSLGYTHKTVNHGQGEYGRNEDGDGFYEIHCNTQEGVWQSAAAVINEVLAKDSQRSQPRKITILCRLFRRSRPCDGFITSEREAKRLYTKRFAYF